MSADQSQKNFFSDFRALGAMLSQLEARDPAALQQLAVLADAPKPAQVIGITGPPGAGKSTLINSLIRLLRQEGKRVAVLAVDPTSPFTGGAVLGDRVRMQEHAADAGVFIRSLGSRGAYGGLSRVCGDAVTCLAAAGFDVVLVETVGVGQSELDVALFADTVIVVLVPEAGDAVQALKAGLFEVGDIFAVNKADRPGAAQLAKELQSTLFIGAKASAWHPPVLEIEALSARGVDELWKQVQRHQDISNADEALRERRRRLRELRMRWWLRDEIGDRALGMLATSGELDDALQQLSADGANPYRLLQQLIERLLRAPQKGAS